MPLSFKTCHAVTKIILSPAVIIFGKDNSAEYFKCTTQNHYIWGELPLPLLSLYNVCVMSHCTPADRSMCDEFTLSQNACSVRPPAYSAQTALVSKSNIVFSVVSEVGYFLLCARCEKEQLWKIILTLLSSHCLGIRCEHSPKLHKSVHCSQLGILPQNRITFTFCHHKI